MKSQILDLASRLILLLWFGLDLKAADQFERVTSGAARK